jgi:Uma2 family endonuclease
MSNVAEKLMSLDEFLVWERDQPEKHEYAGGVITMMTGASLAHATITMNVAFVLRQALRGTGCRPFANDAKAVASDSVRYPDVVVTCQPVDGTDDIVPEPIVVIEVISPSTEREDRGRKKFDYFATPSIRQYALIEQDERRIDLYTRTGASWIDEVIEGEAVLNLSSIGVEISLDTIYEDTELAATRRREGEGQIPAA